MSMRPRRGVALLVALVALVLIGALVTATLFRVQSDARLAREAFARRHAEAAAERTLRLGVTTTSSATVRALRIGGEIASTNISNGVTTVLTTVRVDSSLAWLVASSSAPSVRGTARAQLGVSARIAPNGGAPLQILPGDAWTQVY